MQAAVVTSSTAPLQVLDRDGLAGHLTACLVFELATVPMSPAVAP